MPTQPGAKRPDIKRVVVGTVAETPFSFDGAVSVIGFHIQALADNGVPLYVSLEPGGTFSPDNFYTLKADFVMTHRDINWSPDTEALYLRSSSGDIEVEVWYWS